MFKKQKKLSQEPRRSRTSTEQKRTFVSYHASRKSYEEAQRPGRETSAVRPPVKRVTRRTWPAIAAVVLVFACVFYITSLNTNPKLIVTNPTGVKSLRSNLTYQEAAQEVLNSSIMNRNKITVNTQKVTEELQKRFPELSSATIVLPLMSHRPIIEVTTSRPELLLASQGGVYVIDSNGKAMLSAKDVALSAGLIIPTVTDEANLDIDAGKGALSKQDVTFITTLVKQFEYKNIKITSMTLPPLASELHVRVEGQPYYIKFSLLTDPQVATGQYFAIKDKLEQEGKTPKEYIDSRVEEKVFFK